MARYHQAEQKTNCDMILPQYLIDKGVKEQDVLEDNSNSYMPGFM